MDLLKVFFVILIAFTCQILAKPPRNQNREKRRNIPAKNMDLSNLMVPAELPQGLKMNMFGWSRKSRSF